MNSARYKKVSYKLLFDELKAGNSCTVKITSDSMTPVLRKNSSVKITPINDLSSLAPLDIIAYKDDLDIIIHRYIATINDNIYCRGDNCQSYDNPINKENVLGKVNVPKTKIPKWLKPDQILLLLSLPITTPKEIAFYYNLVTNKKSEGLCGIMYKLHKDKCNKIQEECEHYYYRTTSSSLIKANEFDNIATILSPKKIIPLKGIFLEEFIYKNPGLRYFSDIDILIKQKDFNYINQKLINIGYQNENSVIPNKIRVSNYTNSILYKKGNSLIHIHWHLINSSTLLDKDMFNINQIWDTAKHIRENIYELAPKYQLTYLSHHTMVHGLSKLILIRDLYEYISKSDMDWNNIIDNMTFYEQKVLYIALSYYQYSIPNNFSDKILTKLRQINLSYNERLFLKLIKSNIRHKDLSHLFFMSANKDISYTRYFYLTIFPKEKVSLINNNLRNKKNLFQRFKRGIIELVELIYFIIKSTIQSRFRNGHYRKRN